MILYIKPILFNVDRPTTTWRGTLQIIDQKRINSLSKPITFDEHKSH